MYLVQDKINFHKSTNTPGGICDMTFYYLLEHEKMIEVQDLSKPINGFVFLNNVSNGEGFDSENQYDTFNLKNTIYDKINNTTYTLMNIHFQGRSKQLLNDDLLTKLTF